MVALKRLRHGDRAEAEVWAGRSLQHFEAFQKVHPTWYNINHFASQAYACLGKYNEALECFLAMYKKQGSAEKPNEVEKFKDLVVEIRSLRKD